MANYTPAELTALFDERAAIREYDGLTVLEYGLLTEEQRKVHRRAAEQAAYYDLKKLLGDDVRFPAELLEKCRKFRPE